MKILSFKGFCNLLSYYRRILSTLSFRRIGNILKLKASFWISALLGKNIHRGKPLSVSIEPVNYCNLHCQECPVGSGKLTRKPGRMDIKNFKIMLEKLPRETLYLTLYFQGEPYLNTLIFEMIKQAKKQKLFVSTSTNGHFLDPENTEKTVVSGIDEVIISLDASTPESYLKYRIGGDFNKLIQGIQNLVDARNSLKSATPLISLQFIVFSHNQNDLKHAVSLSKKLKADILEFKSAQHYDFEDGNPFMTSLDKYSRYRKTKDGKYIIKNALRNRCYRMWSSCVITWDGNIIPCCYDKDAQYSYGNLLYNDFSTIWNGEKSNAFRKKILTARKDQEICRNCTE